MKKIKQSKSPLPPILNFIKNYKPFEIDYKSQKMISYTAFSTYLTCPKKWSLLYREGHYQSAFSINMTFGTALHSTIQHYLTILYNKSGAEADRINLESYFEEKYKETYLKEYKDNNNQHFSNPEEMREFYDDGINILNQFKKLKNKYFTKRGWYLVGCEIPIVFPLSSHIIFKGSIDLVLYNENTGKFVLYDLKTSKKGWYEQDKKDDKKLYQLLLYKNFFSEQFNIPIENIDVEFFILKRKLPEENTYFLKHFQQFVPPSGKNKVSKATQSMEQFIEDCFEENKFKEKQYDAKPDEWKCKFCVFSKDKSLCSKGIS